MTDESDSDADDTTPLIRDGHHGACECSSLKLINNCSLYAIYCYVTIKLFF